MADKITFWKGVSAGFLAGMTVAAALRYTRFEKFINNLSTVDGTVDRSLERFEEKLEDKLAHSKPAPRAESMNPAPIAVNFAFRRDIENDPDARASQAARTDAIASFLRYGRRPSIGSIADTLEHADEGADHLDLSKPLRRYAHNLDVGSAG